MLFPSAEFVASEAEVAFWSNPELADKLLLRSSRLPEGCLSSRNMSQTRERGGDPLKRFWNA
jgi:hypothetical protein